MKRDVFQALADPTRRAILLLISMQAMTPNALAENFQITRQAVSKHLRYLTECAVVRPEQQGREIYYHLEIGKTNEITSYLDQLHKIWEGRHSQLDTLLEQLKSKK